MNFFAVREVWANTIRVAQKEDEAEETEEAGISPSTAYTPKETLESIVISVMPLFLVLLAYTLGGQADLLAETLSSVTEAFSSTSTTTTSPFSASQS